MNIEGKDIEISEFNGRFVATIMIMSLDETGRMIEIPRSSSGDTEEEAIHKLLAKLAQTEAWHKHGDAKNEAAA